MTIKQLIKLEDKATEVWVISPSLHYDIDHKDFTELVSVNLGEKTKYKYIVPASKEILKNITLYKKKYDCSEKYIRENFLLLPESEFNPFVLETAIYNANSEPVACAAPALEGSDEVIRFNAKASKELASAFKKIWKKYHRVNP